MVRVCRPRLSWSEKNELWQRWRRGESQSDIARALHRVSSCVHNAVATAGGIAPRPRGRSARALTGQEREEISRAASRKGSRSGRSGGSSGARPRPSAARWGAMAVAARLSRRPRPIVGPGGRGGVRNAVAWRSDGGCCRAVAAKLARQWSPQQIAGWLRQTFPGDPAMQVSHETIYRSLFVQSRGVLKRALMQHLRRPRRLRRARAATGRPRSRILDAVSIRDRPAEVGRPRRAGALGRRPSSPARTARTSSPSSNDSRASSSCAGSPTKRARRSWTPWPDCVRRLPQGLMKSLTWDRGTELAAHRAFTVATDVQVYFCDPYSPWQRGSNENTNGLLRQYLPRGTDLSPVTQRQLDAIALRLNTRPRLTLGFQTPADKLAQIVASTG